MENTAPDMSLNAFKPETNPLKAPSYYKPKKRIRIPFMRGFIVMFLLFVCALFAGIYVPQAKEYVPQPMTPYLYLLLRSTPLPKTADYVLYEAAQRFPSIQTATITTHIEIFDLSTRGKNSLIVDGTGAMDLSKPLLPQAVQDFKGVLKLNDNSETFDAKSRLLDSTYYFQTSHPNGLPRYADKNKWYSSEEIPSEISTVLAQLDHFLNAPAAAYPFMTQTSLIGHERERYMLEMQGSEEFLLTNAKIVTWINAKNWYLEQMTIEGRLPAHYTQEVPTWLRTILKMSETSELGLRFELTMRYVNQPQRLVVPLDATAY